MSTAFDFWKTHDAEGERKDQEDLELMMAAELALDAFANDGFLPGGYDSGDVDVALLEDNTDLLHRFSRRKSRFELLSLAQELCEKREQIALRLAREGLKKEREQA